MDTSFHYPPESDKLKRTITEVTRRNISDAFILENVFWWGRFEEQQFLARLYNLVEMRSTDRRCANASEDIWQHRQRNTDWPNDWVFYDSRFNLIAAPDEEFLRFLCEMLHPVVQPQAEEVERIRKIVNNHLLKDGWEIRGYSQISGRPIFSAIRIPVEEPASGKPSAKATVVVSTPHAAKEKTVSDFDLFICHASEDKNAVARPLAGHLTKLGCKVWFDEFTLKLGDSLRRSIDRGLASTRYGVVILSPSFFAKNWPQYELDGLVQRENSEGRKVILPIWHEVNHTQVAAYSPTLADRLSALTSAGLESICGDILGVLELPKGTADSLAGNQASISSEEICPKCGEKGEINGYEGSDGDEFHWFECSKCGHFAPLTG
jgi:hypothetical protein